MPDRVFIAISIPSRAKQALRRHSRRWHSEKPSWVAVQNYHITLAFLGTLDESQLAGLGSALPSLADTLPSSLSVREIAPFPRRQGTILAALIEADRPLLFLHQQVNVLLKQQGLPTDGRRPFRPHITLARSKTGWKGPEKSRSAALSIEPQHLGIYAGHQGSQGYRYHCYFRIDRSAGSSSG